MKERPILFSAPMVRAILEGRKTQTRRAVKFPGTPPSDAEATRLHPFGFIEAGFYGVRCPYGQPGDRLWVRETWTLDQRNHWPDLPHIGSAVAGGVAYYRASFDRAQSGLTWRPSIHMPRWASRIALEVTGVRVERLKHISGEDAEAEGMVWTDHGRTCHHSRSNFDVATCPADPSHHPPKNGWAAGPTKSPDECLGSSVHAFGNLWESINGAGAWDANPWVWVISFKRVTP